VNQDAPEISPEEYEQALLEWLRRPHVPTDQRPPDLSWRFLNLLISLDRRLAELEAIAHTHAA
jgi:hypothetical protein